MGTTYTLALAAGQQPLFLIDVPYHYTMTRLFPGYSPVHFENNNYHTQYGHQTLRDLADKPLEPFHAAEKFDECYPQNRHVVFIEYRSGDLIHEVLRAESLCYKEEQVKALPRPVPAV